MGNTVSNTKKTDKNESIKDISNNMYDLSEVDSLNWNNLNTDEMSISDNKIISTHNINTGSLEYLNNLEIPTVTESEDVFTAIGGSNNVNQIVDINLGDKLVDSISSSSPFISSEMYKFVMKGGAGHEGDGPDDDSESSATSSSDGKENDDEKDSESESDQQNGGSSVTSASYISSSDHCGDANTSSAVSTDDRIVSSSLNTSDINLISLKH
jgi:hypothetical protein